MIGDPPWKGNPPPEWELPECEECGCPRGSNEECGVCLAYEEPEDPRIDQWERDRDYDRY